VTLDADLQNPAEEIPKLLAKIDEGYGRRRRLAHEARRPVLSASSSRGSSTP